MNNARIRIVVLASGNGSNFQAIVNQVKSGVLDVDVMAVISDQADAFALERARRENINATFIDPSRHRNRGEFDAELARVLAGFKPDLIVLAGFMRILTAEFVSLYEQRIMNIHPSLLPRYKGMNTHARVLEANDSVHGATVHFVTSELDSGPIIIQGRVAVLPDDTPDDLRERVHLREHEIYPLAIQWFASGELSVENGDVMRRGRRVREEIETESIA